MADSYWSRFTASRLNRRKFASASASVSIAAALFAACGSGGKSASSGEKSGGSGLLAHPADTTKQAKRGGTMKDRTFGDPPTLDIFTANNPLNAVNPHT